MHAMDCKDIKALISAIVDDELDAETRHLCERHLAECRSCRAVLNEAEGLDRLLATQIAADTPAQLPDGFAEGVLRRTVYADPPASYPMRWTTWTGWVAAAACLALALTIFISDRRGHVAPASGGGGGGVAIIDGGPGSDDGAGLYQASAKRSFILEGSWPGDFDDADDFGMMPTGWEQDERTLATTAMILESLRTADLASTDDLAYIRDIAEYEDLLERLAVARLRLPAEDGPLLLAAEGLVHRIVNGTVDTEDYADLSAAVDRMNLDEEFDTLSRRWDGSSDA